METRIIQIKRGADIASASRDGAEVLNAGGLVAFPTETVYGVGARADRSSGLKRLRQLKSRSADKPFTVHIGSFSQVVDYVSLPTGVAGRLVRKAWPGPLTLIVPVVDPAAGSRVKERGGATMSAIYFENTIGLRFPDDAIAQELLKAVDGPVVAASANRSSRAPPRTAGEVLTELGGQIDLLIDGGKTRYGKASTIVRLKDCSYEVVREGVYDARIVEEFAMFRLLLVCTGNTCRSPMAAGLARVLLAKRLECSESDLASRGVEVQSAGTMGGGGGASIEAVAVMSRRGIDLSGHNSIVVTPELIHQSDEILVMTESHRQSIVRMVPSAADRAHLLLGDRDIRDPIGAAEEDYEECARILEDGLAVRLDEVVI